MSREEKIDSTFDMITWAFGLGQHSKDLKNLENLLEEFLNKTTFSEEDKEMEARLWAAYHQLEFIVLNMEP